MDRQIEPGEECYLFYSEKCDTNGNEPVVVRRTIVFFNDNEILIMSIVNRRVSGKKLTYFY